MLLDLQELGVRGHEMRGRDRQCPVHIKSIVIFTFTTTKKYLKDLSRSLTAY